MDRFVVRNGNPSAFLNPASQPSGSSRGQRTLCSLAKVVTLPRGVSPRVFSNEYLLRAKEVLESSESSEEALVDSIRQLSSLIMTEQHLMDTGLGKTVKNLSKHAPYGAVQSLARSLLSSWREAVHSERNGTSAAVGPSRPISKPRAAQRTPYARPESGKLASSSQPAQLRPCSDGLEPIDGECRGKATSLLTDALIAAREGAPGDDAAVNHARKIAKDIEVGVLDSLGHAPPQYRRKCRELVGNFKRNEVLRSKVLVGWVHPRQLVRMTPTELDSRENDFHTSP